MKKSMNYIACCGSVTPGNIQSSLCVEIINV